MTAWVRVVEGAKSGARSGEETADQKFMQIMGMFEGGKGCVKEDVEGSYWS